MPRLRYDHTKAKRYALHELGLPQWDAEGAAEADAAAFEVGLTQPQFDAALMLYARQVKRMWTPENYAPWARIALALHFTGAMPALLAACGLVILGAFIGSFL